jgi:hypothetical protein
LITFNAFETFGNRKSSSARRSYARKITRLSFDFTRRCDENSVGASEFGARRMLNDCRTTRLSFICNEQQRSNNENN